MKVFLTLMAVLLSGPAAWAVEVPAGAPAEAAHDAYYKVGEVKLTEETPRPEDLLESYLLLPELPKNPATEDQPAFWDKILNGDWNTIVLVGKQLLEIVKANQAVVNVQRDVVHAIPAGVNDWQLLAGWQPPMAKIFRLTMKNKFGGEVVNVRVKVTASWGGSAGGRGRYLANVIVVPTEVYAAWGWNLDVWSESRPPLNAGTVEAPVAGLGFDVRFKAKTMVNELLGAQDYYMTGDGKLQAMEAPAFTLNLL